MSYYVVFTQHVGDVRGIGATTNWMSHRIHPPRCTSSFAADHPSRKCTRRSSLYVISIALPVLVILRTNPVDQGEGGLSVEDAKSQRGAYKSHLESCLQSVESYSPPPVQHDKQWTPVVWPASTQANGNPETGLESMTLTKVGKASVEVPDNFVSLALRFKLSLNEVEWLTQTRHLLRSVTLFEIHSYLFYIFRVTLDNFLLPACMPRNLNSCRTCTLAFSVT